MKDKFIRKFMRLAKQIGEDENPCYSRQIGTVIVDPASNAIRATGYNGPPPGTPHTDSYDYLRHFFWPQLTQEEIESVNTKLSHPHEASNFTQARNDGILRDLLDQFVGKRTCPRRLVDAATGERNELCSCGHAERHALTNAECCVRGFVMFCWCTVPCIQCSDAIIHAGISTVHCLTEPFYHPQSVWLLENGGVKIVQHRKEDLGLLCQPCLPKPD